MLTDTQNPCFSRIGLHVRQNATNVDKLDEVLASKIDFSLVHGVDGHSQSLVHGCRAIGPADRICSSDGQHRYAARTLADLDQLQQPLLYAPQQCPTQILFLTCPLVCLSVSLSEQTKKLLIRN